MTRSARAGTPRSDVAEHASDRTAETTTRAGRGLLSISGGKVAFIVAGYLVQLLLPRLLGTPEAFGLYASAMSLVSILNNVLIVATLQTVSKRVSEDPAAAGSRLREGLTLQLLVGAAIGGALLSLAPAIAKLLFDPLLTPLLRTTSVVVFSYALYAALIGYLNGLQRFVHQAGFDLSYTVMRTLGILGAAALGFGALGAVVGFAVAAVVVTGVALFAVGTGARSDSAGTGSAHGLNPAPVGGSAQPGFLRFVAPWARPWLRVMAPLWAYQLCLNVTLQADLTVLKRNVAGLQLAAGVGAEAAADMASRYAGFYRAAQTFSFVPYQLILSVALVVFPMVSQAQSLGDHDSTRRYIQGALRFSAIVLFAIAAPVSGASQGVLLIAYPEAYLAGADALSVLSVGMALFALFVIAATIMSGAGRPGVSALVTFLSAVVVVTCNQLFVAQVGVGPRTLAAAATATSVGTTFALLCMATLVYRRFGAFLPLASAFRVAVAAACAFAVARALPHGDRLAALGALVGGGLAYLTVLVLIGELRRAELTAVLSVLSRRKGR